MAETRTIQIRRATATVATANDVTLASGEMGYETDTGRIKVGDGSTAWTSLPYLMPWQIVDATREPTGFPNRTDSLIDFDEGLRHFRILPAVSTFDIWIKGRKYTYDEEIYVEFADTEGMHYAYFDSEDHNLKVTTSFTDLLINQHVFVAALYWNATDNEVIFFADERHGMVMDSATHAHLHQAFGSQWVSGGALGNITANGNGSSNTHAQLSVTDVRINDEDIHFSFIDGAPQDLSTILQAPVWWRDGALSWRRRAANGYPVLNGYSTFTRLAYNLYSGGSWSLAEVTNNNFVLAHIFCTNDVNEPVIAVVGQNKYNTLANARDGALTEIVQLSVDGLPFQEFVALGTVIFQTSSSYSNTPKARVRTTEAGTDYIDWRSGRFRSGIASISSTSPSASNVSFTPTGSVAATDVQGAIAEVDSEKLAAASNLSDVQSASTAFDNIKQAATDSTTGVVELATAAETTTGTDTARAVTPDGLAGSDYGKRVVTMILVAPTADVSTGDKQGGITFRVPSVMNGWNLVGVAAWVDTAGTTGNLDIQIHNITQAADMLSTKMRIEDGETDTSTSAQPGTVDTNNDDVATGDKLRVDVDSVQTTKPKGLNVELTFQAP